MHNALTFKLIPATPGTQGKGRPGGKNQSTVTWNDDIITTSTEVNTHNTNIIQFIIYVLLR